MSKQPASFDPKKHFASVPTQQGKVQQDSDWNKGGAGRPRGRVRRDSDWNSGGAGGNRGRRRGLLAVAGVVVVLAEAVGGLLLALRHGAVLLIAGASVDRPHDGDEHRDTQGQGHEEEVEKGGRGELQPGKHQGIHGIATLL